jgi:hypothetical protein
MSIGRDWKNCRSRKVPKTLNSPGSAMPRMVFSIPRFWMISYCGRMNSWPGTIRMARKPTNRMFLPGKSNRANPYPAMVHSATWPIVRMTVSSSELPSRCQNGMVVSTLSNARVVGGSGRTCGGTDAAAESVLNEVRISQTNGKTMITAPAISSV